MEHYEINRGRPEARSLLRWNDTSTAVGFPHVQQAAEMHRFIDRSVKPNATKQPEVEIEFLLTSLTSAELTAASMLRLDREYWGIENGLHLRLDVSGQEDKSRVRTRRSAFNLCLFRRAAHSFAVRWIQSQSNKRLATTRGFYDDMAANHYRKAFSLTTARKSNWLPTKRISATAQNASQHCR